MVKRWPRSHRGKMQCPWCRRWFVNLMRHNCKVLAIHSRVLRSMKGLAR